MNCIGLDIGKSSIDIFIPINESSVKIENNTKALKSLYVELKKLYKKSIEQLVFVYEPTGSYSHLLKRFCNQKNIKCFIVNPKQSYNFAKAIGQRGKSDIKDAKMLSKMIEIAEQEDIYVPIIDKNMEELNELISYYNLLIKQRIMSKNHLEAISARETSSMIVRNLKQEIKSLSLKIDKCVQEMKKVVQKDKKLNQSFLNIKTIKGIGDISALVLLHHFIKYPDTNQRQIISLAGLDPIQRCSGTSLQSKARISKAGSKTCRATLFMATMVAIRHNDRLKEFYEHLKNRGKHSTLAQIAVMRKMIIIAHSIYKNSEEYDSKRNMKKDA